jgi:hypothetical protein
MNRSDLTTSQSNFLNDLVSAVAIIAAVPLEDRQATAPLAAAMSNFRAMRSSWHLEPLRLQFPTDPEFCIWSTRLQVHTEVSDS